MARDSAKKCRDQLWLIPDQGRVGTHVVADVAVDTPAMRTSAFAVPDDLRDRVRIGVKVRVPDRGGKRQVDGICVGVARRAWDHTLRSIKDVISTETPLTESLVELGLWVADYYHCPPARTLRALAPALAWAPTAVKAVNYLRSTGKSPEKRLSVKQSSLLDVLADRAAVRRSEALRRAGVGPSTLKSLRERGLVEQFEKCEPATPPVAEEPFQARDPTAPEDRFVLNAEQERAIEAIGAVSGERSAFRVFLLFGVPGSGKTEVYVRAARRTLAAGRQVIVIVPEIALATHLVDRLAVRFDRVCVLHSRLSVKARRGALRSIRCGQVGVVIGTRTAVFAPCPDLGLIVVDEEQEGSLKNLVSPRYHARDTAIKRGELENIPVVLGTATPALETWYNATVMSRYRVLSLPQRVGGAEHPQVRLVIRRRSTTDRDISVISPELRAALRDTLEAREQAILLHNRRGYAVNVRCVACGLTLSCERCGTHLVYHRGEAGMKCHICGARKAVGQHCPDASCGGRLERTGLAIQRLEEELGRTFPAARLMRLDSDTMKRREDYRVALERFGRREVDILIGTQMVAKGLDFPGVRLVGVIEADSALTLPDFRAAERTFQLIAQVVGRAGRRKGGSLAVIQSESASLGVVRQAVEMDYEAFARDELERRKRLFYPPFSRMIRCVCSAEQRGHARHAAEGLVEALRANAGRISAGIQISDGEPCVISRQRDRFRYQLLIRAPRDGSAQRLLHDSFARKHFFVKKARLTIDVDPIDLL